MSAWKSYQIESDTATLRATVSSILRTHVSAAHRNSFVFLIDFFQTVIRHERDNLMGPRNIAIILGPILMRSSAEVNATMLDDMQLANGLVEWMLANPLVKYI